MTIEISANQLKAVVKVLSACENKSYMQKLHAVANSLGYASFEALSACSERGSKLADRPITWWNAQHLGFLVYALSNNEDYHWRVLGGVRRYRLLGNEAAFSQKTVIQWLFGIDRHLYDEGTAVDMFDVEGPPFGFENIGDVCDYENVFASELEGVCVVERDTQLWLAFDDRGIKNSITRSAQPFAISLHTVQNMASELVKKTIDRLFELTEFRKKCIAHAESLLNGTQDHCIQIFPSKASDLELIYQLTGVRMDESFPWHSLKEQLQEIIDSVSC